MRGSAGSRDQGRSRQAHIMSLSGRGAVSRPIAEGGTGNARSRGGGPLSGFSPHLATLRECVKRYTSLDKYHYGTIGLSYPARGLGALNSPLQHPFLPKPDPSCSLVRLGERSFGPVTAAAADQPSSWGLTPFGLAPLRSAAQRGINSPPGYQPANQAGA